MLNLPISVALTRCTSSQGSVDGPSRSVLPDGQTTAPCGPEARLASLSAPPGSEKDATTSDTSPRTLPNSSQPVALPFCSESKSQARLCSEKLQSALEARLRERLSGHGSMIYSSVWKPHTTPAGRAISRLRASARSTSAKDAFLERCGWPTPMAGTPAQNGNNPGGNTDSSRKTVALCGRNTPRATDGSNGGPNQAGGALSADVALAGWPTATTRDHKDGGNPDVNVQLNALLGRVVWLTGPMRLTARGELLTGSAVGTESVGQLNPRFSAWLMGYPPSWCVAALLCPLPHRSRRKRSAVTPAA